MRSRLTHFIAALTLAASAGAAIIRAPEKSTDPKLSDSEVERQMSIASPMQEVGEVKIERTESPPLVSDADAASALGDADPERPVDAGQALAEANRDVTSASNPGWKTAGVAIGMTVLTLAAVGVLKLWADKNLPGPSAPLPRRRGS
ncbi:MAG: hypothetical protein HND42_06660 [Armatimonadetes bacterium]|nr:hypothetical protein [Armatimonadota bacterium]NOG92908.1 hypothetical protein [Armatimonadota bacterium]